MLFLVVGGAFLPIIASAETTIPGPATRLEKRSDLNAQESSLCGLTTAGGCIINLIKYVDLAISTVIDYVANYTGALFTTVISTIMQDPLYSITRDKTPGGQLTVAGIVFLVAWNNVKVYANMLIVLGLIVIAVATIIQFRAYEAQKILPILIIVALLVNFSVVLVGFFIDLSNVAFGTLSGAKQSELILKINGVWDNVVLPIRVVDFNTLLKFVGLNAVFEILYIIVTIALLWFIVILIERYVILAILFILSPLAFVFFVFPISRGLWNRWWNTFLKWCFAGLGGAFFLNLSISVLVQFEQLGFFNPTADPVFVQRFIFAVLIVIAILIIGLRITVKSAGPAAEMAMGLAKAAGVFALGAVTGGAAVIGLGALRGVGVGAKGTAQITGLSGTAERARNTLGSFAKDNRAVNWVRDKIGGVGSSRLASQKRVEENLKKAGSTDRIKNLPSDQLERIATSRAITERGKNDKLAAIKRTFEEGKSKNLTAKAREDLAKYGAYHGLAPDIFTKEHPELLTGMRGSSSLLQKMTGRRSAGEKAALQSLALQEQTFLESTGYSPKDAARLVKQTYRPTDTAIKAEQQKLHQQKVQERALGYGPINLRQVRDKVIDDHIEKGKAAERILIETANPTLPSNQIEVLLQQRLDAQRKQLSQTYKPSASELSSAKSELTRDKISKAIGKLSPYKAAELPTEAVSPQTIAAFSDKQLEAVGKRGGPSLVDEVKKYRIKRDAAKKALPIKDQTKEFQDLISYYKTLPAGSTEQARVRTIIKKIQLNTDFD